MLVSSQWLSCMYGISYFSVAVSAHATHNVTINKHHVISCDFTGYPLPSLTWTFNGRLVDTAVFNTSQKQIMGNDGEVTRSYLNFTPHSTLFTGEYICTAERAQMQAHCRVKVNVQGMTISN